MNRFYKWTVNISQTSNTRIMKYLSWHLSGLKYHYLSRLSVVGDESLPWCTSRGLGRLVTQVWGHMSTLAGWREPSRNFLRVSDKCIPPKGVLGRWLGGTSAKQYIPTWCILSTAWRTLDIHWKLWKMWTVLAFYTWCHKSPVICGVCV